MSEKSKKHKVVDLFAGVGGLSYGFVNNESFEIVLANEFDKDVARAYELNHPGVKMVCSDIAKLDEKLLQELVGADGIDLVVGGPPCQSYSTLGKRQMDSRAHLFEQYCRLLSILKPKAFVYENVQGLLSMQCGNLIRIIKSRFSDLGYEVKSKVLNAADYGVPQFRERVILVGTKGANDFEYPSPTHGKGLLPYVTLEAALSDLPALESGGSSSEYASEPLNPYQEYLRERSSGLEDHSAPRNGPRLMAIMKALPEGGSKEDLPKDLRPSSGYCNTYAKMWWKRPAPTITRNFGTPSSSRCIHPRESRALTTREGARLQSFPDRYRFHGSRTKKNLEIGNAVPPLLSVAIASQIGKFLDSKHKRR